MVLLSLILALATSSALVDAATVKPKITNLVVFGDSISDNGRAYRLLEEKFAAQGQSLNDSFVKTDPAYCQGKLCRFTDGPVWVEDLAKNNSWILSDYAVGGSTSDNAVVQVPQFPGTTFRAPSAVEQLGQFFANASDPARNRTSTSLYVIFTGTNDVTYNSLASANTTVNTIGSMVARIKKSGGKYILVVSLYDLSKTPGAYSNVLGALGPNMILSQFSSTFQAAMSQLAKSQNLAFFSAFDFFTTITTKATSYGYDASKVTKSCLVQASIFAPRSLCSNPDKYIYFDTIHPTRKTHNLMGVEARKVLASHYGI